jgi:hypothetical protein
MRVLRDGLRDAVGFAGVGGGIPIMIVIVLIIMMG